MGKSKTSIPKAATRFVCDLNRPKKKKGCFLMKILGKSKARCQFSILAMEDAMIYEEFTCRTPS